MPMYTPPPTQSPFASPDDLKHRRNRASQMMMNGASADPVQHWTQGIARVMQGMVGAHNYALANKEEGEARSAAADDISGYSGMAAGPAKQQRLRGMLANPYAEQFAKQRLEHEAMSSERAAERKAASAERAAEREADRSLRKPLIDAQVNYYNARAATKEHPAGEDWVVMGPNRSMNRRTGQVREHGETTGSPADVGGIDEDGNAVLPSAAGSARAQPQSGFPSGVTPSTPGTARMNGQPSAPSPAGRMNLGGSVEPYDEELTMPIPGEDGEDGDGEPRQTPPTADPGPTGYLTGRMTVDSDPSPGQPLVAPTQPSQRRLGGPGEIEQPPALLEQARERSFGPTGQTADKVPGIVGTNGNTFKTDVPATTEAAGQRAVQGAPEDARRRAEEFRRTQDFWTYQYQGRKPQPGHYYTKTGEQVPMSGRMFKGDREAQATTKMHMENIDRLTKVLLSQPWASRALSGAVNEGGVMGAIASVPAAAFNTGDTAQAFSDLKQAALGIAYLLSGKQVAVKEMENFTNAYAPSPGDSERRIQLKVASMKRFYGALLEAAKSKEIDERDVAKAAAAATGAGMQPQGSGQPQGGGDNPLANVPTEELLRRLNSGR